MPVDMPPLPDETRHLPSAHPDAQQAAVTTLRQALLMPHGGGVAAWEHRLVVRHGQAGASGIALGAIRAVLGERRTMGRARGDAACDAVVCGLRLAYATGEAEREAEQLLRLMGDGTHLRAEARHAMAVRPDHRLQDRALRWSDLEPGTLRAAWEGTNNNRVRFLILQHPGTEIRDPAEILDDLTATRTPGAGRDGERVARARYALASAAGAVRPLGPPAEPGVILGGLWSREDLPADLRDRAALLLHLEELRELLRDYPVPEFARHALARCVVQGSRAVNEGEAGERRRLVLGTWCLTFPDHADWHGYFQHLCQDHPDEVELVVRELGSRLPVQDPDAVVRAARTLLTHPEREVRLAGLTWLGRLGGRADAGV